MVSIGTEESNVNTEYHTVLGLFKEYEVHQQNQHLRGDQGFQGPSDNRTKTDVWYFVVFFVLSLILAGLSVYVYLQGDPHRLSHGFDLRAEICGAYDLQQKRFMFYPDPANLNWSLCITACPFYFIERYYCIYEADDPDVYDIDWGCWDAYQTTAFGFYCIPVQTEYRKNVLEHLSEPMQVLKRSSGDILLGWDALALGELMSVVLGIFCIFQVKRPKTIKRVIQVAIVALVLLGGFLVYILVEAGKRAHNILCENYGPSNPSYCDTTTEIFYYSCAGVVGILLIISLPGIYSKYKDIDMSVSMLELTSRPIQQMKGVYSLFFGQLFLGNCIIFLLGTLFCFTMSTGTIIQVEDQDIPQGESRQIEFTTGQNFIFAYVLIMTLWLYSFLSNFSKQTVSGSVATWYFAREKSALYVISIQSPVKSSTYRCLKFHLGSIVLGSLIRPLLIIPQAIIKPIYKRTMRINTPLTSCKRKLIKACYCIKWYYTWMRYYTKRTFIMVNFTQQAIFGQKYSDAAQQVYFLMERNKMRVGRPASKTGYFVKLLGWVIILAGVDLTFGLIILSDQTASGRLTVELVNPIGPLLFSFLICFFVSEISAGLLYISVNTVLVCAACDQEMFTRDQRFIQDDLVNFMDGIAQEQNENYKQDLRRIVVKNQKNSLVKINQVEEENDDFFTTMRKSAIAKHEDTVPDIVLYDARGTTATPPESTRSNRAASVSSFQSTVSRPAPLRAPIFVQSIQDEDPFEPEIQQVLGRQARFVD